MCCKGYLCSQSISRWWNGMRVTSMCRNCEDAYNLVSTMMQRDHKGGSKREQPGKLAIKVARLLLRRVEGYYQYQ